MFNKQKTTKREGNVVKPCFRHAPCHILRHVFEFHILQYVKSLQNGSNMVLLLCTMVVPWVSLTYNTFGYRVILCQMFAITKWHYHGYYSLVFFKVHLSTMKIPFYINKYTNHSVPRYDTITIPWYQYSASFFFP